MGDKILIDRCRKLDAGSWKCRLFFVYLKPLASRILPLVSCLLFLASCLLPLSLRAEDTGTIDRSDRNDFNSRYSISFNNANLKEALRFLSGIAGVNMMIPEDVTGTVTTRFDSATIPDAINSIVKANGYDYAVERGIWRIGKDAQFTTAGEDLKTETIRLKYASAKDLTEKIKALLTTRGSIFADERTNSLVVKERPANIENVRRFVEDIDVRDAQVLIEAKILEATRDFSRNLGIQWGVTSTGTRTGVSGVTAVGTNDAGRTLMPNLPMPQTPSITTPTSGLGLIIGSLAGGTTIDMQITAAEQHGDLNIISEPTIVTSNGVPANIRSGETMYIKTVGDVNIGTTGGTSTSAGSSGQGLQEVRTGIELNVTPQISVDNYIKLAIVTQTSQLDFTRTVDGIPVVIDSNASTSVVVKDGETTIIGGLARLTGSKMNKAVPGLSKIPLLGELFKSRAKYKQNKDLMIFIRPTIIKNLADIPDNAKYGKFEEIREQIVFKEAPKKEGLTNRRSSTNKYQRNR